MHKSCVIRNILLCLCMAMCLLFVAPASLYADENSNQNVEVYYDDEYEGYVEGYNSDTEYYFVLDDCAQLLDRQQMASIVDILADMTEYENIAMITITENNIGSSEDYAKYYIEDFWGIDNASIFLIDMDKRNIWLYSNGDIQYTITSNKNDIISDNVYQYASNGDYYTCISEGLTQMLTLLEGNEITSKMKYISNICLAIVFALILNYILVKIVSADMKASLKERLSHMEHKISFSDTFKQLDHTTKHYSPRSSDSSSGDGGGGGGGGSSGGHGF